MSPAQPPFDPEMAALLERGRKVGPVPDVVRARCLARARAAVTAAVTPHPELRPARWPRALPVTLAAAIALIVGAAGAVAALRHRAPQDLEPTPPLHPAFAPAPGGGTLTSPPEIAPPPELPTQPASSGRPSSARESYAAELKLLRRAQVAFAGRDFASALSLVAEHGRLFPAGRLVEEREALRVRSLAGLGRADEAARAAASFAHRFPRSALLPRSSREPR